jgi:hypothetical protein
VPLFIKNMTFKDKVQELINAALAERPELFLVDFSINDANKISINLDGDQGVNLQDCIDVSRAVENQLDTANMQSRMIQGQLYYTENEKSLFERRLEMRIDQSNPLELQSFLAMYPNPVVNKLKYQNVQ